MNDATGNPFRYTGRRLDAETGLYYYRARYYFSALGRFLQTDPVGYGDNMNMYAYVANDPINAKDPSGRECVTNSTDDRGSTVLCDNNDSVETDIATLITENGSPERSAELAGTLRSQFRDVKLARQGNRGTPTEGNIEGNLIIDGPEGFEGSPSSTQVEKGDNPFFAFMEPNDATRDIANMITGGILNDRGNPFSAPPNTVAAILAGPENMSLGLTNRQQSFNSQVTPKAQFVSKVFNAPTIVLPPVPGVKILVRIPR